MFDTPLEILMTTTSTKPRKRAPAGPVFQRPEPPQEMPQEALISDPRQNRPSEHNGVLVVSEQAIQNLPKAPFKISRLLLADGAIAFACRECLFTADTRGLAMTHRVHVHGNKSGGRHPRIPQALLSTPDPILPERADGILAPTNPMEMTLGEFIALAPSIAALGDLVEKSESERDAAVQELSDRQANRHKLETWDEMRDELTVARQQLKQYADYDQNRAELMTLRNWKRKMITRLRDLGFQLTEEDQ